MKGGHAKKTGGSRKKKVCVYDDKGMCSLHGVVGQEKWKPTNVLTVGSDGKLGYEYQRVIYYECDVVLSGGSRQGQKRLSSGKTTSSRTPKLDENISNLNSDFSTSTELQSTPERENQTGRKPARPAGRK